MLQKSLHYPQVSFPTLEAGNHKESIKDRRMAGCDDNYLFSFLQHITKN
jgi:hypothetical protein